MSIYVVDCSVAVKWFLPEPQATAAARIHVSRGPLHVPDLFHLEFGSAVLKRIRRKEITLEEGIRMVEEIRLVPMQRHTDESLFPLAFEIASIVNASIYDCMYLALAVRLSALVVTADKRFLRSIADTEYADYALWIEDLPAA